MHRYQAARCLVDDDLQLRTKIAEDFRGSCQVHKRVELQVSAGPLWVCEGAFDVLALLAAGVPRMVALQER